MAAETNTPPSDFVIPDALPVLPLRDAVVLPLTMVPLAVGQPQSIRLVDDVMRGNRLLALVAQRDAKVESAKPEDLHRLGTAGVIHQFMRVPDGSVRIMVQGIERIRLTDFVSTDPYLVARVEVARAQTAGATEVDALRRAVLDIFRRLVEASPELPDELAVAADNVPDPLRVAYFVASVVPLDAAARQQILEMDAVGDKLRRLVDLLQRELGEEEDSNTEVAELRRRLEEAGLPEEARREADRELGRLGSLPPASP